MATSKTIGDLPEVLSILDTSNIPVESAGVTSRITGLNLKNYISALSTISATSGVISGSFGVGSLSVTGTTIVGGNLSVANAITSGNITSSIGSFNSLSSGTLSITGLATFGSNVSAGNVNVTNGVYASSLKGTLLTAAQPNVTSVGTLADLTVTNPIVGSVTGSAGNVTYPLQPNITAVGNLTSLNVVGTTTTGTLNAGLVSTSTISLVTLNAVTVTSTNLGGTITTAAQPNITSLGTLTSLGVTGNVNVTSGSFVGSGSGLTGTATNLSIGGNALTSNVATEAINIAGGAAGSIPVQTSANTTSFIAGGTSGQVLTSTGSATTPTWQAVPPGVPTGTVIHVVMNTPPTGYLKANGALVSRTTYATLFAAIGTTFGAGDGSTTFALPDLRGEFIRGWDDGRGVDSGRAIDTAQTDAMQGHLHSFAYASIQSGGTVGGSNNLAQSGSGAWSTGTPTSDGTNGTPRTASETRPCNIALLACIKY